MSVISYLFIAFLICTLIIYYIMPGKFQWIVLLGASLVFYGYAGIKYLLLVVTESAIVYLFSLRMQKSLDEQEILARDADRRTARKIKNTEKAKRKKYLVAALFIVITILVIFKALGFLIENIKRFVPIDRIQDIPELKLIAPLGMSFYTFMIISYLVDLYNGRISAQRNFFKYLTYVMYFPHVTQGPIARYEEVGHQLWEHHRFNLDVIMRGVWLIIWGAFKKMVIADRISVFTTGIFGDVFSYEGMIFWTVGIAYSIQIYCDFSGCMDIMRGASECFGIVLGENFRRPYFSQTLPEFWRRWHISLGAFFREYVFYPVSTSKLFLKLNVKIRDHIGNVVGKVFAASIPILCVWMLTGLWHGAVWNYIAWGLYHGILICMSTLFEQPLDRLTHRFKIRTECASWQIFRILRTFVLCVIGRLIFMGQGIGSSIWMIRSGFTDWGKVYDLVGDFTLAQGEWSVILISCIVLLAVSIAQEILERRETGEDIRGWLMRQNVWFRWLVMVVGISSIVICGVYGSGATKVFIYEQF